MLKWIDDYLGLPRTGDGPTPCILLDEHPSRLEIPFLSYINRQESKYNALIGLPYATIMRQVGGIIKQNGCFKMYQYDVKIKKNKQEKRVEHARY